MTSITSLARRLKSDFQRDETAVELVRAQDVVVACRSAGHRWRECFWSPCVTVMTFVRQVLHGNCSCREAVALTLAALADRAGETGPDSEAPSASTVSGDPSAYSQARQKLPGAVLEHLNRSFIQQAGSHAKSTNRWCDRSAVIVDGSSTSTADTPELQKKFPQPSGQKPGCGFPVMRLVAIFCWASGCLLDWAADSLHVGELTLFRRLMKSLAAETVVLGDTYYGSYYDLVLLRQHHLDGVFRLHQRRSTGLRFGTRLGEGDHLVTWTKPKIPPRGVSPEEWKQVSQTLTVRHVRRRIDIPGFRSRELNVVTTLLDPSAYPPADLAQLYRDRWLAELNLRCLKTTLKMETLKSLSPGIARKELLAYQLAYNLIRLLMWRAAEEHQLDPRRLSFAGTQQRLKAALPFLASCRTAAERRKQVTLLLACIAADLLPARPNRIEPRAVKRRPKNYRRLTRPRAEARKMANFING